MRERDLAERVARLFNPPDPTLRGGVEAAGELPTPAASETSISVYVETLRWGVRVELQAGGLLRVLAYEANAAWRKEALMVEQRIDVLVRETLRREEGKR
jgi:hypothetical protein